MIKCPHTGKICYPTREQADAAAHRFHPGTKMLAYDWCDCGSWHLAKKNRRSRRRGDVLRGFKL